MTSTSSNKDRILTGKSKKANGLCKFESWTSSPPSLKVEWVTLESLHCTLRFTPSRFKPYVTSFYLHRPKLGVCGQPEISDLFPQFGHVLFKLGTVSEAQVVLVRDVMIEQEQLIKKNHKTGLMCFIIAKTGKKRHDNRSQAVAKLILLLNTKVEDTRFRSCFHHRLMWTAYDELMLGCLDKHLLFAESLSVLLSCTRDRGVGWCHRVLPRPKTVMTREYQGRTIPWTYYLPVPPYKTGVHIPNITPIPLSVTPPLCLSCKVYPFVTLPLYPMPTPLFFLFLLLLH